MLSLARYTLKGPGYAIGVVAVLSIIAIFLPLVGGQNPMAMMGGAILSLITSVLVALIILTQGLPSGSRVIAFAIAGIVVVSAVVLGSLTLGLSIGVSIALAQWLPVMTLSGFSRVSGSLGFMLLVGVVIGTVAIVLQMLLVPELQNQWQQAMIQVFKEMPGYEQAATNDVETRINDIVRWMVLGLVPCLYLMYMGIMFLARSLDSQLSENDSFKQSFRQLTLGKSAAGFALAVLALSFWQQINWIDSLALLMVAAFLLQGIAVVHVRFGAFKQARLILTIFYVLLLLFPQVVAITAISGILDNWLVFRRKSAA